MNRHLLDGFFGTEELVTTLFELAGLVGFDFQWFGEIAVIAIDFESLQRHPRFRRHDLLSSPSRISSSAASRQSLSAHRQTAAPNDLRRRCSRRWLDRRCARYGSWRGQRCGWLRTSRAPVAVASRSTRIVRSNGNRDHGISVVCQVHAVDRRWNERDGSVSQFVRYVDIRIDLASAPPDCE